MKKFFLVLAIALMTIPTFAQDDTYTRGKGFFARPDIYGGFFANVGYQNNPYFQVSLGPGLLFIINNTGTDIDLSGMVHGGIRAYTSTNKWTGLIDYHAGILQYQGYQVWRHSLVGGASYKDLDFGGGLQVMFGPNGQIIGYGPLITAGWNFRFYKHN